MKGRLNLFQAAMLRWRELYPYNAVHVAELPGPLDVAKLTDAIAAQLTVVGRHRIGARRAAAGASNMPAAPRTWIVEVIEGDGDSVRVLEQEMERQLNMAHSRAKARSTRSAFSPSITEPRSTSVSPTIMSLPAAIPSLRCSRASRCAMRVARCPRWRRPTSIRPPTPAFSCATCSRPTWDSIRCRDAHALASRIPAALSVRRQTGTTR